MTIKQKRKKLIKDRKRYFILRDRRKLARSILYDSAINRQKLADNLYFSFKEIEAMIIEIKQEKAK